MKRRGFGAAEKVIGSSEGDRHLNPVKSLTEGTSQLIQRRVAGKGDPES